MQRNIALYVLFYAVYKLTATAYKQEQRGRKEAAADRKKKVQLSQNPPPNELPSQIPASSDISEVDQTASSQPTTLARPVPMIQ